MEERDISQIKVSEKIEPMEGVPEGFKGYYSDLDGGYVGNEDFVKTLLKKGIVPEKAQQDHNTCSIGFCDEEQKWYGWSHRAMYGFGIGHKCKKGDSGVCLPGEKFKSPVWYPQPGFECKTLDDCKKVAIAFSDSVS